MFFSGLRSLIWGVPTIIVLVGFGFYFSVKTRFFQISGIKHIFKDTVGSLFAPKSARTDGISPFSALMTALGGTVGVGSVVGVGVGIAYGGAGSVFWMWISGFFGMMLKYSETFIALGNREKSGHGGANYRLFRDGKRTSAVLFSFFCVMTSFGVGNLTQVNAVTEAIAFTGASKLFCGLVCALPVLAVIIGGKKRISFVNSFLMPLACLFYLGGIIALLIMNIRFLPSAFSTIFSEAFGFKAAAGGFCSAMLTQGLREGFARGVFSNEAGMGSSPLAYAAMSETNPRKAAEWGIVEVFCDTFVISTLTALALLCAGKNDVALLFLNALGVKGGAMFAVLVFIFAFASVISWCCYGESCIGFLSPKKHWLYLYRVAFAVCAFLGAFVTKNDIWNIADILNAMMMAPNLYMLFLHRKEVTV